MFSDKQLFTHSFQTTWENCPWFWAVKPPQPGPSGSSPNLILILLSAQQPRPKEWLRVGGHQLGRWASSCLLSLLSGSGPGRRWLRRALSWQVRPCCCSQTWPWRCQVGLAQGRRAAQAGVTVSTLALQEFAVVLRPGQPPLPAGHQCAQDLLLWVILAVHRARVSMKLDVCKSVSEPSELVFPLLGWALFQSTCPPWCWSGPLGAVPICPLETITLVRNMYRAETMQAAWTTLCSPSRCTGWLQPLN